MAGDHHQTERRKPALIAGDARLLLEYRGAIALVGIAPVRLISLGHARVEALGMKIGHLDLMAGLGQAGDELIQHRAAEGMSPRMVEDHQYLHGFLGLKPRAAELMQ
jgi:hypothetical protein